MSLDIVMGDERGGVVQGFLDSGAEPGAVGRGIGDEAGGEGAFVGDAGEEDADGIGDGQAAAFERDRCAVADVGVDMVGCPSATHPTV